MNKENDPISSRHGWGRIAGIAAIALFVTACGPVYEPPEQVAASVPTVSYSYGSDDGLIEANSKARSYCAQYNATPLMHGSIVDNADGTRTVTFECAKTGAVATTPAPAAPAETAYVYRTDAEFLSALRSADAYCARSGQVASTRIVTNPDGSKTMTYQCVPR